MSAPVILGIAGSPRRHGNSARLLEAALAGAREAGAETRLFVAADAGMSPCRGCNACSSAGECVVRDGGAEYYAAIDAADGFIVASPVFFATVPAVLKILIDRLQPYWARRFVLGQELTARRPGAILLARSGGDSFGFSAAEATIRSAFAVLGIDMLGEVRVEGVEGPADLAGRPEAIEEATALGRAVAEEAARRPHFGG